VKPASALAIALAAAAVLPATAAAASQTTTYKVVKATGSQRVEYTANGDSCSRFGTCGFGGTITYKFTGTPKGHLVMKQASNGHITGAANFTSKGTTVSDVTSGGACHDIVRHKRDEFSLSSKSRLGKLLFGLHGGDTDYLLTDCGGPTEKMLARDKALPSGTFKRAHFDAVSTTFGLKGSSNFSEAGYVGSVTWKLSYSVKRG